MSERTIDTVTKRNIPELLVPVGGWAQLEAAVNNGADAVYMGGPLFNARIKADNFSGEKLKEAIDFAHEHGVKVYITLNTLIKDRELQKAFDYACDLYETGADAVILQDMGLARLIHKYLPDFPMHLSTQGTVYNISGLETAAGLGFTRVVPARETSLDEIRRLCKGSSSAPDTSRTEVEVFVHGALCMCYSGQCQMSRLLGGGSARSGNRGLCAQPCRLQYTDDRGEPSYALSPKDICTIEDIPALCEAGVDSFKIEGRLKSPEYVATVTRIYRKYLDRYVIERESSESVQTAAPKVLDVDPQDIHDLLQIFNRGGFTKGYIHENPGREILSGSSPKNRGVLAGEVVAIHHVKGKSNTKSKGNNKGKEDRRLIDVKLAYSHLIGEKETIGMGDGIELSETGNVVTYIEKLSDDIVRIGDFRMESGRTISRGEKVYKVTDKALNDRAMLTTNRKIEATETAVNNKALLSMNFRAEIGECPVLTVVADGKTFEINGEDVIEKALKRPADPDRIREQLGKLGGTPFVLAEANVNVDCGAMVPISIINEMRRRAVDEIAAARRRVNREPIADDIRAKAATDICITKESCSDGNITSEERIAFALVPLEKFMDGEYGKGYVPYVINVSKGNTDRYIEENFGDIVEAVRDCGIALGNLGWIREFRAVGVKVYGDYGLNVFNSQAEKLFDENDVKVIAWSDELSSNGNHCTVENDNVINGPARLPKEMNDIPLMITEHPLSTDYLTDRKGVKHKVLKWYSDDKYLIF